MKKIFALAMALLLTVTMILPASADLIVEPQNAFFERHRNECTYVNRPYIVNGESGYIATYSAPGALLPEYVINGTRIYVSHTWVDYDDTARTKWAVTQDGQWMQMSELALVYDYQEFEADFGGQFKPYDGTGGEIAKACFYSYPGGVYVWTWDAGYDLSEGISRIYVDAEGRSWGFVGYYMGRHNQWICLDDPLNENLGIGEYLTAGQVRSGEGLIAPVQPPVTSETPEIPGQEDAVQNPEQEVLYPPAEKLPASGTIWVVIAVLIVAVAVVTAVIIRKRRK